MCGVSGYVMPEKSTGFLESAISALHHRGPDSSGIYEEVFSSGVVGLGHNRLSILDLSTAANQPMRSHDGNVTLVYNGEIYNFEELKQDLIECGWSFNTTGDTEVVVVGWLQYGAGFISKLRGMFAIALWESTTETLHLFRDQIGEKPLFYRLTCGGVKFASEPQVLKEPGDEYCKQALAEYLTYLYIPYPRSIYKDIAQLEPGQHVTFRGGKLKKSFYYEFKVQQRFLGSYSDAMEETERLLRRSVQQRMVSDRPLGVFLSGGLDSSLITALAAQSGHVNTYSIGYSIPGYAYDETKYAQQVAEFCGTSHKVLLLDEAFPADAADKICRGFGQPFGNPTSLLTYLLTKTARQEITVGLVGDGADELFYGYPRYDYARLGAMLSRKTPHRLGRQVYNILQSIVPERTDGNHLLRRVKMFAKALEDPDFIFSWASYFRTQSSRGLIEGAKIPNFQFFKDQLASQKFQDEAARASYLDLKSFVPCNLMECADRMGMQNSFELRSPYLDLDLVEFAASFPPTLN